MTTRSTSRRRRGHPHRHPAVGRADTKDTTAPGELLEFATRWRHFGGAPTADVYTTFGLTEAEYRSRLRQALTGPEARGLSRETRQHLRELVTGTTPPLSSPTAAPAHADRSTRQHPGDEQTNRRTQR